MWCPGIWCLSHTSTYSNSECTRSLGPETTTWGTSELWISIIPPPSLLLFNCNIPRSNSLKVMYFNVQSLFPKWTSWEHCLKAWNSMRFRNLVVHYNLWQWSLSTGLPGVMTVHRVRACTLYGDANNSNNNRFYLSETYNVLKLIYNGLRLIMTINSNVRKMVSLSK